MFQIGALTFQLKSAILFKLESSKCVVTLLQWFNCSAPRTVRCEEHFPWCNICLTAHIEMFLGLVGLAGLVGPGLVSPAVLAITPTLSMLGAGRGGLEVIIYKENPSDY